MKAEILVGPERRRRWDAEEKARTVAEATVPEARVADLARRHGVSRSLIYTWRREASRGLSGDGVGAALPELVPVVASGAGNEPASPGREKRRTCSSGGDEARRRDRDCASGRCAHDGARVC
jgi:transposase